MTNQTKPEGPDAGESSEAVAGGPQFQRTPGKAEGEDSKDPASKPQGTLEDQKKTMDNEGSGAIPELDDLPATLDDQAERAREEKLVRDGSGY